MLQITSERQSEHQRAWETLSAAEFYAACIGFLRRQSTAIAVVYALSLVAAIGYILITEARYTSRATLIVEIPKVQLFPTQAPIGDAALSSASVDTQIEILNSDDIALSVIKDLHLDEDPEFVAPSGGVLRSIIRSAGNTISKGLHAVLPLGDGTSNRATPEYLALETFHKRLKVRRLAVTYALEINFDSRDPYRAAQVANAIADAYELNAFEAKYQIAGKAAEWLQARLQQLREEASSSERAVVDYKSKHNIVDAGGRLMNEQQLAELDTELIQARTGTAEAEARLARIQEIVAAGDVDPSSTATATVADTLHNDVISKLRIQYLDDERRANEWASKYGAGHMAVITLRNQMSELRRNIFDELKRTAEGYKSDYAIAKAREDSIQQSLDQLAKQSHTTDEARVTLHNLESSAQTSRDLYDNFLQRYMQSLQQQSSPVSDSRLITHARPPLRPSWPRPLLIIALASLGGLIFGSATGMLRDISDRVFRTTKQIDDHLQANCIAVIPQVNEVAGPDTRFQKSKAINQMLSSDAGQESTLRSGMPRLLLSSFAGAHRAIAYIPQKLMFNGQQLLDGENRPRRRRRRRRTLRRDSSVSWMVSNAPFSRFSESIRAVKVAADSNISRANRTIGITSSLPNEGKSTVALSLATIISQGGGRAILVDCDLRNPALSLMLTPDAKAGLIEVASGKTTVDEVLWREPTTGLAFLPGAVTSRVAHTSDILASKEMRNLFDQLRGTYDYVIVDLSPLAPVVDVRVMTPMIDSFLFVVEWGRTKIEVAQVALNNARGVCENLLGVVLNKADMKAFGRYASDHENYYNNSYYDRYGYGD
jgi:polysaccharide biosynthesis transport protein